MTDTPKRRFEAHFPAEPLDWSDTQAEQSSTAGAARQGGNTSDELSFEEALLKRITDAYVAKFGIAPGCVGNEVVEDVVKLIEGVVPPLTAPAPLTDERIDELCKPWVGLGGVENQYAFARAIERETLVNMLKAGDAKIDFFADQAAPAAPVQPSMLVPKWAGYFHSYQDWVNKGQSRLASPEHRRAMCVDAKGRRCAIGKDFMLARDEDAFPVRYFWECELAAPVQADQAQAAEVRAQVPDVVREAIEATFEQRPGYLAKVAAAVRVLAQSSTADKASEVRAAEWISVEDRLPEIDYTKEAYARYVKVLVAWGNKSNNVAEMRYASNGYAKTERGQAARFEWQGKLSPWPITHWMPLPAAPSTADSGKGCSE